MDLLFAKPELLDADLDEEVCGAEFEAFWREVGRPAAKAAYARLAVSGRTPFVVDAHGVIDEALSLPLRTMAQQVPGRTTMETYGRQAFNLLAAMSEDGAELAQIDAQYLARYKARRKLTGIKTTSWNAEAAALRTFFDAVVLCGIRADNPCLSPFLKWTDQGAAAASDDPKFITLAEFEQFRDHGLLEARNGLRNAAFAEAVLTSGMRLDEANAFRIEQLPTADAVKDLAGRSFVHVAPDTHAKGGRGRKVRIGKGAFNRMRRYADGDRRDALIRFGKVDTLGTGGFWLNQSAEPMTKYSWDQLFQRASARSGVKVVPHTLRHTFAVYLLSSLLRRSMVSATQAKDEAQRLAHGSISNIYQSIFGDPLRTVQRALGHRSYETTFIYLDVLSAADKVMDEALEIFDTIFAGEEGYSDVWF